MLCKTCNKKLKDKRLTYCSHECHKKQDYLNYIDDWKNDKVTGMKGEYQISAHIKRYLFLKYNNQCGLCNWGETNLHTGKIPLEVEHIDGDFNNNKEDNLLLLCPNCHSLTPTYKGANRGNGRTQRKKYS